jgi:hypothetical protein
VPIFLTPQQGATVSSFYQVMSEPGYEAIQWIRQQTPVGSVCVSDALYGWWLSGFAQRPTLSAVEPQYLTLSREFEPAKIAANLLDTDYLVDNGLLQIREDGGYIGRHNPEFLAKLYNVYEPYPLFHFNDSEITVFLRKGNDVLAFDLTQLPVKDMGIEADSDYACIFVDRGNQFFNFTEKTTVYRGIRFANMSVTVESNSQDVSIEWVRFILHIKGIVMQEKNSVALLDEGTRALGQVIFAEKQPKTTVITSENPSGIEFLYNLEGQSKADIKMFVGVYQIAETKASYVKKVITDNLNSSQEKVADFPLDIFDYQKAIKDKEISYIACRNSDVIPKFANDPAFSLVFINDDVAIFIVKRNFNQLGRPPSS